MNAALRQRISEGLRGLSGLFGTLPEHWASGARRMERDIVLPVRLAGGLILFHFLFGGVWFDQPSFTREVVVESLRGLLLAYLGVQGVLATVIIAVRRIPPAALEWIIFVGGLWDAVLVVALTLLTGGFDSILFWMLLVLIVRHAISLPQAAPGIGLNLTLCLLYLVGGVIDVGILDEEKNLIDPDLRRAFEAGLAETPAEPLFLRVVVLLLTTACCHGAQALIEKRRLAREEAEEMLVRNEQLHAAGRISAEIAHRLKNPLAIITNAAFLLQRSVRDETARGQLEIIREEVTRSDRILTELMGHAKLADGKVERLNVVEELNRAVAEVFPPAASFRIALRREFASDLPALLMQRAHLSEIFVNLLQNAREALGDDGRVEIRAGHAPKRAVEVSIADNGPGIPPDRLERIFENSFSTKETGSGLGLAIVKHNTELYGGSVRVESTLGLGARFTLTFPARTLLRDPDESDAPSHPGR